MMLEAVLSNADHPEYGVATIPFPIPKEQYDQCIEMVKALEIGDPFKKDCKVMAIDSFYSVLKITEISASIWMSWTIWQSGWRASMLARPRSSRPWQASWSCLS